ncbi:Pathogenicity cluster 5 protein d [Psilocybe cubensis]|uniref:Carbohydrate-binding module family 19 domain-containing protein n=2 Tax=Psilocybe cubensis TaxID=181762 RepID=A0A8H7Y7D3_PSICU|nr:Pathogenicity cluster 5 protein d [Psilocybe cubensis]KAH9486654.1 Pathogenicity cluster 5 protein d [Psilocybe cubensis]
MQISFVTLALALTASAVSLPERAVFNRRAAIDLQNGQDAIALNNKFKTLTASSPCTAPENACVGGKFAQCVGGKFTILGCAGGTVCAALPNVGSAGTSIACTTQADLAQRLAATGAQDASATSAAPPAASTVAAPPPTAETGSGSGDDAQTSLTLDPAVIAKGFANDGQDTPTAGQVASLTSTNNFINFCKTVNLPLTNGAQVVDGSCNPAPMGVIPAKTKMPSSKFIFPPNNGKVAANQLFTIKMAINNLETGNFVNAAENYFSAPQQLNAQGLIRGHSHVVIEKLDSLDQTTTTDPTVFAFFKGLNGAASGGVLTADVDKGLPAGFYKLSSINTAANHQPVLVPVAQHGSLDDAVYFTVA